MQMGFDPREIKTVFIINTTFWYGNQINTISINKNVSSIIKGIYQRYTAYYRVYKKGNPNLLTRCT